MLSTTLNASVARSNLYRLMDQVSEFHQPILITGKHTNSILVAQEDWNNIQETLYLTSIPGFIESVKTAEKETDVINLDDLQW